MTSRAAVFGAALALLTACSAFNGPDWLVGEARSPDGAQVARLWCEDFCDVGAASTLTISPASRRILLERKRADKLPEGELPRADVALRIFRDEASPPLRLDWLNAGTLLITGHCISDGNYKPLTAGSFRTVRIRFRDVSRPGQCEPGLRDNALMPAT